MADRRSLTVKSGITTGVCSTVTRPLAVVVFMIASSTRKDTKTELELSQTTLPDWEGDGGGRDGGERATRPLVSSHFMGTAMGACPLRCQCHPCHQISQRGRKQLCPNSSAPMLRLPSFKRRPPRATDSLGSTTLLRGRPFVQHFAWERRLLGVVLGYYLSTLPSAFWSRKICIWQRGNLARVFLDHDQVGRRKIQVKKSGHTHTCAQ